MSNQSHNKEVQRHEEAKQAAAAARFEQIITADYSAASSIDELYNYLSTEEIKTLRTRNKSFKTREAELDNMPLPQTTTLSQSQDEIDAARAAEAAAAAEVGVTTEEQVAADEQAAAETAQAEADRLVAEAAAAGTPLTVQRNDVEILYDGVEKLGEGSYKLSVDPEDGTSPEVFYGATQADCFKKLRKSKAHATKELRRRARKLEITDELRALQVEVVPYEPLLRPLALSPDDIFTMTERRKELRKKLDDPAEVLRATRELRQIEEKLYLASLSPEECARKNEETERKRFSNGYNTAISWLANHPEFYNCTDNIKLLQEFMSNLNWAVTENNMDLAFSQLQEQGVLLERPEETEPDQPVVAQPASVVPVATPVAVTPAPAPASAAPKTRTSTQAATTGALPAATKVMRPGSSTGMPATRRSDSVPVAVTPRLTAEEYHRTPASEMKRRYDREPAYRAQVDALIAAGQI